MMLTGYEGQSKEKERMTPTEWRITPSVLVESMFSSKTKL
jgi:hypothetical protein